MQQLYNESFKMQLVNSYESGTTVKSLCIKHNIPQSTMPNNFSPVSCQCKYPDRVVK